MPVELKWHMKPSIMLITVSGDLTANEIEDWLRDYVLEIETSTAICHVIIDISAMTHVGVNVMKMPSVFNIFKHPQMGWTVVIGTIPLVSFWLQLLGRTSGMRYKVFTNVDDATEFLTEVVRIADVQS